MGKTGKAKKKGEYRVGLLTELIADSCGVSKPVFDPKLESIFGNTTKTTTKVKPKQTTADAFPEPPSPVVKRERPLLSNKVAADIRVGARAKAYNERDDVIKPQPMLGLAKSMKAKKVKKERHRNRGKDLNATSVELANSTQLKTPARVTRQEQKANNPGTPNGNLKVQNPKKVKKERHRNRVVDLNKNPSVQELQEANDGGVNENLEESKPKKNKKSKANNKIALKTGPVEELGDKITSIKLSRKREAKSAQETETNPLPIKKKGDKKLKKEDSITDSIKTKETEHEDSKVGIIIKKEKKEPKTLKEQNAPKDKDFELESRTVFVGNVPTDVSKKQLLKLFKTFGKVETVRLRCGAPDKPTVLKKVAINKKELHPDRNSLAAYVRFSSRKEAETAQNEANGMEVNEHHLTVNLADNSNKPPNSQGIFIGNLHIKTEDEEVYQFFNDCGNIRSVRVVRDRETGIGKGFGFVNFDDRASVEIALKKDGQEFKNRPIRVTRCVKKLKTEKTFNGFQARQGEKGTGGRRDPAGDNSSPFKKRVRKSSQGLRQRKEEFSGDRTAEIGKLKKNSRKPNRLDMKKSRIAKKLMPSNVPPVRHQRKEKPTFRDVRLRPKETKPVAKSPKSKKVYKNK